MSKPAIKLKVRLPPYQQPRSAWRRAINLTVAEALAQRSLTYKSTDRFELSVRLYFLEPKLHMVDIDNRVKDILDALQGHIGGAGKKRRLGKRLIENDSQIFRIRAEKCLPPKQSSHMQGHLVIRKYKGPKFS